MPSNVPKVALQFLSYLHFTHYIVVRLNLYIITLLPGSNFYYGSDLTTEPFVYV